eukprot:1292238-Pyramimonas_sp.AAC.1
MRDQCGATLLPGVLTYQSPGVLTHIRAQSPLITAPRYSAPTTVMSSLREIRSQVYPRVRMSAQASLVSSITKALSLRQ